MCVTSVSFFHLFFVFLLVLLAFIDPGKGFFYEPLSGDVV